MPRPTHSVSGRTVLITGAANGIGLATARALAARGARLALLDLDPAALERAAGELRAAAFATADVADVAAVDEAVAQLADTAGPPDVVFANAGVEPPDTSVLAMDPAAFDRVLDVNLHGVWHTVHATLPHVVERRGYLLLNASMYAFMSGAMAAPYAVAKAGVEQLGRALRTELRPHGASAGVTYFGFLQTDLVRRTFSSPVIDRMREVLPGWFTEPVPVERGVEAIVRAIEHRSARAFAPRWVGVASALRGVLGPLDERLADDPRVHEAIRLSEARARSMAPIPR